ncbi:hydroxypyruvate isomerase family protein [Paenibacillus gansuensis]|uniref:Hydroxypyruvate isomerase family protein n=1 Tax=Paenibacillus gansuensis TaxID=306542 RepID=A0ABW5PAN2_9BACL
MKFSVCIDAVYSGADLEESLASIQKLGFRTFEFWTWWDKDIDRLNEARKRLGLNISCFCTKFISLVDESQRAAYLEGLSESIETAKKLGCTKLITQVGNELEGVAREVQRQALTEGLKAGVPMLEEAGITLLVEPLNLKVDHAGYFLSRSDEAFEIIREVNSSNVKLLFDIYHQQITEGDLIRSIQANVEVIGHFHAAGHPGRHELHTGEIHYSAVFEAIRATRYDGDVGLEYFPTEEPEKGLARLTESAYSAVSEG